MPLAADILSLRDRTLSDLADAHDYYTHSATAWEIVGDVITGGRVFSIRSITTGTITTETALATKAPAYVRVQLSEATFQQFISIFESFVFDLLRLWLLAYPRNLSNRKVDFQTVLDATDKDAIALHVVSKEVNDIMYDRPANWFAYLEDKLKLGCPTADEIERIAESKATRDVLAHNRGVANKIYVSKGGRFARYSDGQRIEVPEPYHRATWELFRKVVADVSDSTLAKLP